MNCDCMMGIQLKLILTTSCIVDFGLTLVQARHEVADQILKITDSEIHPKILKLDVAKEAQVFDAMKKELWNAPYGNIHKKKYFYSKNNVVTVIKRETNENFDPNKQPYTFPEIKNGKAIEAVTKLLSSQGTYHKEIDRLFRVMCKKNWKHPESDCLNRSIDLVLSWADQTINNVTVIIQEYEKNGSASNHFESEPMGYKTARLLMDYWKYIYDFINRYLNQFDLDVKEESDAMQKPLEFAISEMEAYHKYLDIVYNETGMHRDEELIEFRYPKYGKWFEKSI